MTLPVLNADDARYLPGKTRTLLRRIGVGGSRNVFWSWYKSRNFGDWITPLLFSEITGSHPVHCTANIRPPATVYFAVGSVCRHIWREGVAVVWGSGIIDRKDEFARPKKTTAVRGPLTRARFLELNYECPEVYGDPAILMPDFYLPKVDAHAIGKLGIIPHFQHATLAREWFADREDVRIIDVCKPVTDVIDDITSCTVTVSSSLHGLILSNTYGVPSAWCQFPGQLEGDDVKFLDFYQSGGVSEIEKAEHIEAGMSSDTLYRMAMNAPRPDLDSLRPALRHACPFGRYDVIKNRTLTS